MTINLRPDDSLRLPDFVIIGGMKCGTSTLHEQLARQSRFFMSQPKEPNFFSDDKQFEKGLGWYASLFAGAPPDAICGESSTHYTKLPTYPQCARRLHDSLPEAKLVYVMRDPLDRIVSQYIHEWSEHMIDKNCSIDQAIVSHPELVDYSRYATQLEPYLELFGFDAILPVLFERLLASPQTEFERIAAHIGCTGAVVWIEDEAKNKSSERQRRHPVLNTVLDIRILQAIRRTLIPESVRAGIRARWTMSERPRLSAASVSKLHDELDPDMQRLGNWLGLELTCDIFKRQVSGGPAPEWAARSRMSRA